MSIRRSLLAPALLLGGVFLLSACGAQVAPTATTAAPTPVAAAASAIPASAIPATPTSAASPAAASTAPTAIAVAASTAPATPTRAASPAPAASTAPTTVAAAASAVPATATRAAAPSASAAAAMPLQPRGTVPAGWQVYRGTRVPFAIAYPPDWQVDETDITLGFVYFRAPNDRAFVAIGTTGKAVPGANVDVLRDQYFKELSKECSKTGVDITRVNEFSDITFASVGSTCDISNTLYYVYAGLGLKSDVPWTFELFSRYDQYDEFLARFFDPLMESFNAGTPVVAQP